MDEQTRDILKEVSKEIAKDAYKDGGKPILEPTGKTLGLIPRAIKAALLPIEKWTLEREYNLEETKKILEFKLEKTNPELIEQPEPYIAVPAIQYISYCIDSKELRNMYANLLANSMDKVIKSEVHPSFIEMIKQLSPDEAKILKVICRKTNWPFIKINYENEKGEGYEIKRRFSDIGEIAHCEYPMEVEKYLDNLERLGMIIIGTERHILDEKIYEKLENHKYLKKVKDIPEEVKQQGYNKFEIEKGFFGLTDLGKGFCKICILDKE